MLIAMGAVVGERWVGSMRRGWRLAVEGVFFLGLAAWAAFVYRAACAAGHRAGRCGSLRLKNNGDLREEIGWDELVKNVAANSRFPAPGAAGRVLVCWWGTTARQGAVEILGPAYHLPTPISMTNSAWLRGYPAPPPSTLIVVGFSKEDAERTFTCMPAGRGITATLKG